MDKQKRIRFYLINFLFPRFHDTLVFEIDGISLIYKKVENYEAIEKSLEQTYGIAETCYIDLFINESIEQTVEFVHKVNFLFSFCRGNIINYSRYVIYDENDKEIKTVSIDPISTPYTSLELIPREFIQDTQNFISNAYQVYNAIDNLYRIRKIAREYPTTRNSSTFLHSRSLILTAIVEYILYCYNDKIKSLIFFNQKSYLKTIAEIKSALKTILENKLVSDNIEEKRDDKIKSIVNKMDGLNQTTLKWKFEHFIHEYKIPLSKKDIHRFIAIRNTLAHSLSFPDTEETIECWKFLVNVIDKIVMGLFRYKGRYYNFYTNNDEYFLLDS
jgi:hypothetical protein